RPPLSLILFFLDSPATSAPYALSLHDALPISPPAAEPRGGGGRRPAHVHERLPRAAPGRRASFGGSLAVQDRRERLPRAAALGLDRKSTRLNSSHLGISYAVFCLKKKNKENEN